MTTSSVQCTRTMTAQGAALQSYICESEDASAWLQNSLGLMKWCKYMSNVGRGSPRAHCRHGNMNESSMTATDATATFLASGLVDKRGLHTNDKARAITCHDCRCTWPFSFFPAIVGPRLLRSGQPCPDACNGCYAPHQLPPREHAGAGYAGRPKPGADCGIND